MNHIPSPLYLYHYPHMNECVQFDLNLNAAMAIINLAMPPKSRKVKINMKEFIAKHGLPEEKSAQVPLQPPSEEEEWEDETKSQKDRPLSEQENRKEENTAAVVEVQKREEEARSKPLPNKKQPSFKGLIKQALQTFNEYRTRSTLPTTAFEQVNKENPQVRMAEFSERLHEHYFKVFQIFKSNHPQASKNCQRFSQKITAAIQQFKAERADEVKSVEGEQRDRYSGNILRYYSMELKLKDDEIRRKRNFREFSRGKYGPQIKQIKDFITANSRLVSEVILRERFQSVIDRTNAGNDLIFVKKEQEYRGNMRYLFGEWRKMKKEKMMLDKIQRGERIHKGEQSRAVLAGKFPNFMGLLLNPFNVYEGVV